MAKLILTFFLSTFLSLSIYAQEYIKSVQHFNLEKGLATRNILFSIQDSDGFMWFGTDIGAYRFDGVEFKLFQRNKTYKGPLFTSWITEDDQNNKWFFHPNSTQGLDISILPTGVDTLVSFNEYFKNTLPFPTEEMYIPPLSNKNFIWLRNKKSGDIYEYRYNVFVKIFNLSSSIIEKNERGYVHLNIDKDEHGNNWIIHGRQLYKCSAKGEIIKTEKLPSLGLYLDIDDGRFWFTNLDNKSSIYLKENEAAPIALFETAKNEELNYRYINGYQYIIEEIGENREEFNLIDYKNNRTISFKGDLDDVSSVYRNPNHFYFENENTFWMCIYEGIVRVEFQESPFDKFLEEASTRWIQKGENNKIWAATHQGFVELDPLKKDPFKRIKKDFKSAQNGMKDEDGNYWFGSHQNLVVKFSKNDLWNFKEYVVTNELKERGVIYTVYQNQKDKSIWAGGQKGLYIYDVALDSFIVYKKIKSFDEINQSIIRDVKDTDDGQTILIASDAGLFQIDLQEGVTHHFASKNNTLPYDDLIFIHVDKMDGTLWVGANQGGLIHMNIASGKIEQFTKVDGLSDNKIYAIFEDELGFLWLASNNGLMRFNKKTKEVTTYKKEDGIVHDEFNFFSHFEDEDGTLYLGGIKGITAFHPKEIKTSDERPNLKLKNIEVLDEKGENLISELKGYRVSNRITLSPSRATFKLTTSLLDYKNSAANQYFYKVIGLENRWNRMDGNSIRMNGLPSGEYQILVKAKNADGLWAANQLKIPVKMLKPFFLRGWFIAAMVLLLYGLGFLFVKRRTYILEKDKQKLEEEVARRTQQIEEDKAVIEQQAEDLKQLDKWKSRFFSNVTHELRTPLTLIIGPLKHLLIAENLDTPKARKTLAAIAQNGDQLKELVEEILDLNRLDANKLKLNKEPVRLRNVIEKWVTNFEPEAENRNIDFKLEYNASTNLYLNIDTQKLERIVINLLSNAFKFTRNGDSISLSVSEETDQIKIEVKDTGLGIHEEDLANIFQRFYQSKYTNRSSQGGLGIGLSLCDELAQLMEGKISVTSKLGFGSTFSLVFPKEKVEGVMSFGNEEAYRKPVKIKKRKTIIGDKKRKNILLVEDNVQMQNFVLNILEPIANIQIANNGKEALQILHYKGTDVQLIITDVMMPEMDGFTLLEVLKMEKRWQMTPIVMLTARADIQDKISALRIGVDDYIVKPFESDELVARVQNLLTKIDLRKEPIEGEQEEVLSKNTQKEPKAEYQIENEFEEVESADIKWLKKVEQIAIENITSSNFNVTQFAYEVHLGERQLSRKLKKLTGMTPGNYLKEIRLQTARHLLENKAYSTVSEVAHHVGFSTPEYFSRIFKERFGKLPTEYLRLPKL